MHEWLEVVRIILKFVEIFFVCYLISYSTFLFLSAIVGSISLYQNRNKTIMYNEIKNDYYLPISIIVPAYNEELVIIDTVESLLHLDYKIYEIIVVNDGSKDKTAEKLIKRFNMHQINRPIRKRIKCKNVISIYESNDLKVNITLINKENGGKSDALNMGINASNYPYFLGLDADSILQKDSLIEIAKVFLENDDVIAAGGLVRLANGVTIEKGEVINYSVPNNLLISMQILEYDRSFLAARILFDHYNGNLIISGAFGLFKKSVVVAAGGYDTDSIGEDFELVVKLHYYCRTHLTPYRIKYAPEAVCWTQAPNTLKVLARQRKRWFLGLFQSMSKYKKMFANYRFGLVSYISYFYYLVYELLAPLIEIIGLAAVVLAYMFGLLNVNFMITFFLIYSIFGGIISITTFLARLHVRNLKITFWDYIKAIIAAVFETLVLRYVLNFLRLTAFIGKRKKKTVWDTARY